jgi:hypothetical protein
MSQTGVFASNTPFCNTSLAFLFWYEKRKTGATQCRGMRTSPSNLRTAIFPASGMILLIPQSTDYGMFEPSGEILQIMCSLPATRVMSHPRAMRWAKTDRIVE